MTRDIGGYEVIERIARGGMGDIWRGRHRRLRRDAAIKVLRVDRLPAACRDRARKRFDIEVRVTAGLASPHTIRLFDFGVSDEGDSFYAMELLHGCDLQTLVRRFGPLPADRVISLLLQICDSLSEAHASAVVHRDLKPANLYTCRMGLQYDFAKVIDFGLAATERELFSASCATATDIAFGTPSYMAPEVIAGDRVDARADVYALGCVAYFLLTGGMVFDADTVSRALWQHLHAEPAPPSTRAECPIPRSVDALVLECLQKDPRRRPRHAADLGERLSRIDRSRWSRRSAASWWETHMPECAPQDDSIESHGSVMCPSLDALGAFAF